MNYLDTSFEYFPANIESKRSIGTVTLGEYLKAIKHPKPEILSLFKQIEAASAAGDSKLKAELKAKTFYFTPCIRTDGNNRSYENIVSWTGLAIIDLDNLETEFAKEMKTHIFETYPFVIACFLSASKKGVKAIVRIPIVKSVEEFKSYFYGLMDTFQMYIGIDSSSKNCALPNYLTYDTELLYRLDATEFNRKGLQVDEFKIYEGIITPLEDVSEDDVIEIKFILRRMFDKIIDSGHVIVRSASLLAGGFSSAGYMSMDEMKDYLFELIDDTPYLHKSLKNYKTTCVQMLNKGAQSPVYLDEK